MKTIINLVLVFADYEYRNELAEYIQNNGNKENIKYFIVMAMNKGTILDKSHIDL